jgi:hypothetical protein
MKAVRSLLKLKAWLGYRTFFRGNDAQVIKWAFGLPWLVILMFGSFALGFVLFGRAYRAGGELGLFLTANRAFLLTFLILLFASVAIAYRALFSSPDLTSWLTAPIPLRAVLLYRLAEVTRTCGELYLFGFLPAFLALGVVAGSGALYYLPLLALSVSLVGASAGISTMLVLLFVRHMRSRTVKEAVTVVFIALAFLGIVAVHLMPTGTAGMGMVASYPKLSGLLLLAQPGTLVAWATVPTSFADLGGAAVPALLLLGISLAVILISIPVGERVYLEAYTRSQTAILRKRGTGIGRLLTLPLFAPAPVRAIFMKDLRTISRDLGEGFRLCFGTCLAVLSLMLGLGVFKTTKLIGGLADAEISAMSFLITLVLAYAFFLSLYGFARERKAFWILHSAPVDRRQIAAAKTLVGLLPSLVIIELIWLAAGVLLRYPVDVLVVGMVAVAGALPGVSAIGVLLGAEFAKSGAASSGKFDQGGGEPFFGLVEIGYLAVVVGIPVVLHLDPAVAVNPVILWIGSSLWALTLALGIPVGAVLLAASYLEELEICPRVTNDVIARHAERMAKVLFPSLD